MSQTPLGEAWCWYGQNIVYTDKPNASGVRCPSYLWIKMTTSISCGDYGAWSQRRAGVLQVFWQRGTLLLVSSSGSNSFLELDGTGSAHRATSFTCPDEGGFTSKLPLAWDPGWSNTGESIQLVALFPLPLARLPWSQGEFCCFCGERTLVVAVFVGHIRSSSRMPQFKSLRVNYFICNDRVVVKQKCPGSEVKKDMKNKEEPSLCFKHFVDLLGSTILCWVLWTWVNFMRMIP